MVASGCPVDVFGGFSLLNAPGPAEGVTAFDAELAGPVPAILVAVTVKVYDTPLVKPITTRGLVAPLDMKPPGDEVTVYDVIAEPPLLAGAEKATDAWALPAVATTPVGAPGTTGVSSNASLAFNRPNPYRLFRPAT